MKEVIMDIRGEVRKIIEDEIRRVNMKELTNEYMEELEENYKAGMEDTVLIIKRLYELDVNERLAIFYTADVANIIDRYDITNIKKKLDHPHFENKSLRTYYIIKGICSNSNGAKMVCAMSGRLKFEPTDEMIEAFLSTHPIADFAYVNKLYVRE